MEDNHFIYGRYTHEDGQEQEFANQTYNLSSSKLKRLKKDVRKKRTFCVENSYIFL